MDSLHERKNFVRFRFKGIKIFLNESIEKIRNKGKKINTIVSTGGGTKNEDWLQIQADIFDATIIKLSSEQGPGMGAAMLAAYGSGWFDTLQACADTFLKVDKEFKPVKENVVRYQQLFDIYKDVYKQTKSLNARLATYR